MNERNWYLEEESHYSIIQEMITDNELERIREQRMASEFTDILYDINDDDEEYD